MGLHITCIKREVTTMYSSDPRPLCFIPTCTYSQIATIIILLDLSLYCNLVILYMKIKYSNIFKYWYYRLCIFASLYRYTMTTYFWLFYIPTSSVPLLDCVIIITRLYNTQRYFKKRVKITFYTKVALRTYTHCNQIWLDGHKIITTQNKQLYIQSLL